MRGWARVCAWLLTALLLGAWLGTAQAAPEEASVLILLPGQPAVPGAAARPAGLRLRHPPRPAHGLGLASQHRDGACGRRSLYLAGRRRAPAPGRLRLKVPGSALRRDRRSASRSISVRSSGA